MTMIISPIGAENASARTITDQTIRDQENVAVASARESIEEYTRLLLYIIISRLEDRIETNA